MGLPLWADHKEDCDFKYITWLNSWSQGKFSYIEIYWIVNNLSKEVSTAYQLSYLIKTILE
jgi:hypothetical protein